MIPERATERFASQREVEDADTDQSRSRLYDSFIVRLWRDEGSDSILRAEVEHVQTGLSIDNVRVTPEWVTAAIQSCLRPGAVPFSDEQGEGNGAFRDSDPAP